MLLPVEEFSDGRLNPEVGELELIFVILPHTELAPVGDQNDQGRNGPLSLLIFYLYMPFRFRSICRAGHVFVFLPTALQ